MRYRKPLATSVFIAAMALCPLAAFCDFGANDSQNLQQIRNMVNSIEASEYAVERFVPGLASFLSLNYPTSSSGNYTADYTLFQVLTGNSPLSNFTPLLPSLDKISSALFYYDSGQRIPYLDKLLDIASSLVSEKSGISESLADISYDLRNTLQQFSHDTTNALYDADLSVAQLLATNNYYLSMLVMSNNAAPLSLDLFDMTNLVAMLAADQVISGGSTVWQDEILNNSKPWYWLAMYGVGIMPIFDIMTKVSRYEDDILQGDEGILKFYDDNPHLDDLFWSYPVIYNDMFSFEANSYMQALSAIHYDMYSTYPLFTNSLQIISLLDSINNFTNIQALSFDEQKTQLNQQLQQFTGNDSYYSDNIETNLASISSNDVYQTPDSGYLQGLTDNVMNDSSSAEIDSTAEGFFAKVKNQLESVNSSFNVGSPTLTLHISNTWHDESISLDYHLKSDARAKVLKFWDWIFTIVRWVLTLWAFTYLINLIVSHDKVESGARPEDIFR